MPSFETLADIFTRLSVFDSAKGSSDTFKAHKNISLYFKRKHLIIYKYADHALWVRALPCAPSLNLYGRYHEFVCRNVYSSDEIC